MQFLNRKWLFVLIIVSIIGLQASSAQADNSGYIYEKITSLQRQVYFLISKISSVDQNVSKMQKTISTQQTEINNLKETIGAQKKEIEAIKESILALQLGNDEETHTTTLDLKSGIYDDNTMEWSPLSGTAINLTSYSSILKGEPDTISVTLDETGKSSLSIPTGMYFLKVTMADYSWWTRMGVLIGNNPHQFEVYAKKSDLTPEEPWPVSFKWKSTMYEILMNDKSIK